MPITFHPNYQITQSIVEKLYQIDQIKEQVKGMPLKRWMQGKNRH